MAYVTVEYFDEKIDELARMIAEGFAEIHRDFARKEDLERFATKEDLKQFATKKDLEEMGLLRKSVDNLEVRTKNLENTVFGGNKYL